jgi:hypothetical protein
MQPVFRREEIQILHWSAQATLRAFRISKAIKQGVHGSSVLLQVIIGILQRRTSILRSDLAETSHEAWLRWNNIVGTVQKA